jgi:O-antigen ligase
MPTDGTGNDGDGHPYRYTVAVCALACALAPAYTVRWHVGFYPTTLLEVAIIVSVLVFLVEHLRNRPPLVWRSPLLVPTLLFVLAGAISVLVAPNRVAGLGLYRAYLLEPIAFGFVLLNVLRTPARALLVVSGLFAGAAAAGLANSVVVAAGLANHTYEVTQSPPVVVYLTANAVALFVVPLVAVAGALALHSRGVGRTVSAAFFAIGTVVTFLSFSRGGYLAYAAVVLGLALTHRRRLPLLGLALAGAVGLALIPPIRTRVLIQMQNVYGNTVVSRLDLWTATAGLLRQRPLQGAGLAGFPERIQPFFTHLHTPANFIDPHNIVLNFWVETGLLGLLSMGWIIGLGMALNSRGWRQATPVWQPYHLGVLLALVAVVVHGLVDVPYFKNDLSLEFWTLLAVGLAGLQWATAGVERAPSSRGTRAPAAA